MYKHTHSTFPQKKVSPYKVQPFKHGGTLALEMAFWSLGAPSKNYYNYSSDTGKHKKKGMWHIGHPGLFFTAILFLIIIMT